MNKIKIILITLLKISMFISGLIFLIIIGFYIDSKSNTITNPKNYLKAKSNIQDKEMIKHFPTTIPNQAKNISLYEYSNMPYNGEIILLNFKIDKKYINNELKHNKFINCTPLGDKQKIYNMPKVNKYFIVNNYTYYVLRNKINEEHYKDYFPYFNGIGINKKNNEILYYYINPSD